jgi:hypothetical protein
VIGCARLAMTAIASIRSSDFCARPRPFLELVSNCSDMASRCAKFAQQGGAGADPAPANLFRALDFAAA